MEEGKNCITEYGQTGGDADGDEDSVGGDKEGRW